MARILLHPQHLKKTPAYNLLTPIAGTTVNVPLNANKLIVTKLKLDNSRKKILERLASKKKADKGKVTQQDVSMAQVD